jgi:hypothetical protein
MIGKKNATGLLAIATILCATLAWSQANVNESLETASLYVDVNTGDDNNPGTQQQPLKTIAAAATAAISNNQAGIGTKVIINPGMYREAITMIVSAKDTALPITFEAATTGKAVVTGADLVTGWKVYSGNSNIYTNTWAYSWGLCALDSGSAPAEQDIVRRREMLIINKALMSQVMTLSAVSVPGTFYVDETKGIIYVWPPAGTDMSTATVEIPTRDNLFVITGKSNIVLRGLNFQHANSCRGSAAVLAQFGASNILMDNDSFNWNNAEGVKVWFTTYTTVQNSVANHNGASGMKGFETKYDLWLNDTTRYNGWRGAQGVYYAWAQAGTHFGLSHNQTIKNLDTSFNQTHGLHWDTDNENVTVDSVIASENQLANGFFEKTQGPVTVTNSYFCSGNPYTGPDNIGFELRNSEFVTLSGNTYYNNAIGLAVVGQAGGIPITNWETGQDYNVITQNTTLNNSMFEAGSAQYLLQDGALDGADWTAFQSTLVSDYNTWYNSTATKDFFAPVPNPWTLLDLAGWQSTSGKDAHSIWTSRNYPSNCAVTPDKRDFWFIMRSFSGYQTVSPGGTVTLTAYAVPLKFNGNLNLSSDGVQKIPGATASWSANPISSSDTATFTITTSTSTPKGDYNITLLANAGNTTRTMNVTLTVQ